MTFLEGFQSLQLEESNNTLTQATPDTADDIEMKRKAQSVPASKSKRNKTGRIREPDPKTYPEASFYGIAPELRNIIYEHLFDSMPVTGTANLRPLLTSRKFYHEAASIAWRKTLFDVSNADFKTFKALQAKIPPTLPPLGNENAVIEIDIQRFPFPYCGTRALLYQVLPRFKKITIHTLRSVVEYNRILNPTQVLRDRDYRDSPICGWLYDGYLDLCALVAVDHFRWAEDWSGQTRVINAYNCLDVGYHKTVTLKSGWSGVRPMPRGGAGHRVRRPLGRNGVRN